MPAAADAEPSLAEVPESLLPFARQLFSHFPAVMLALGHPSLGKNFELPPAHSSFTVIEETSKYKLIQVVLRRRSAGGKESTQSSTKRHSGESQVLNSDSHGPPSHSGPRGNAAAPPPAAPPLGEQSGVPGGLVSYGGSDMQHPSAVTSTARNASPVSVGPCDGGVSAHRSRNPLEPTLAMQNTAGSNGGCTLPCLAGVFSSEDGAGAQQLPLPQYHQQWQPAWPPQAQPQLHVSLLPPTQFQQPLQASPHQQPPPQLLQQQQPPPQLLQYHHQHQQRHEHQQLPGHQQHYQQQQVHQGQSFQHQQHQQLQQHQHQQLQHQHQQLQQHQHQQLQHQHQQLQQQQLQSLSSGAPSLGSGLMGAGPPRPPPERHDPSFGGQRDDEDSEEADWQQQGGGAGAPPMSYGRAGPMRAQSDPDRRMEPGARTDEEGDASSAGKQKPKKKQHHEPASPRSPGSYHPWGKQQSSAGAVPRAASQGDLSGY